MESVYKKKMYKTAQVKKDAPYKNFQGVFVSLHEYDETTGIYKVRAAGSNAIVCMHESRLERFVL